MYKKNGCTQTLIRHSQISTSELVTWAEQSGRLDQMFEHMLTLSLPVALPVSLNVSPTPGMAYIQWLKKKNKDIFNHIKRKAAVETVMLLHTVIFNVKSM